MVEVEFTHEEARDTAMYNLWQALSLVNTEFRNELDDQTIGLVEQLLNNL